MRITIENLTKTYGDVTALDEFTLSIKSGTSLGLLGTNGAGKTTLLRTLVGLDEPDAGQVTIGGTDIATAGPAVRSRVGYLPEQVGFPSELTGREILTMYARIHDTGGDDRSRTVKRALKTVGLTNAADRMVDGYSNGMGRRLGLAVALLANPSVLLLDEPMAGLDPLAVEEFHGIVRRIRKRADVTVIMSSHVLADVEDLCEEIAVLDRGRLRACGSVADLKHDLGGQRLTVWFDSDTALANAIDLIGGSEGCTTVTVEDDPPRLTLACEGDLLAVLNRVNEVATIERFEVREPGLDAVFREAVSAGDDRATVRGEHR